MSSIKSKTADKSNCSYCLKDISYKKIQLHERLCQSLMTKCHQCNEVVPIEELEEHLSDFHSSIKKCWNLSKERLTEKRISSFTKVKEDLLCRYCGLAFLNNSTELLDHEYFCGSKSEECCLCGLMIPKKFYNEHLTAQCLNNSAIKRPKKSKRDKLHNNNNNSRCKLRSSTKSKNFSNIRRKLLSLDKEIEKKINIGRPIDIPNRVIKRNLFNVHVPQKSHQKKKNKVKEERNYTIDKYLTKKHLRSSAKKKA